MTQYPPEEDPHLLLLLAVTHSAHAPVPDKVKRDPDFLPPKI